MPETPDYFLPLRYGWRLVLTVVHLIVGAVIVALIFPFAGYRQRSGLIHFWSLSFCAGLGVRPTLKSRHKPTGPALVIANHVSWLDIFAIDTWHACRFVAKAEVGGWPLIGWLSRHAGTLFISRQRRRDTGRIRHQMVHGLKRGHTLAVFPEGTTSDGRSILPFNPSLLQAALDTQSAVYMVTLRYTEQDRPTTLAAYIDEMSLVESLHAILKAKRLGVEIGVEEPIENWTGDRRELAEHCRQRMLHRLQKAL